MRVLHLCAGRGGSLWTGAILGWESIGAVDNDEWRVECLRREAAAGWWPGLRTICAGVDDPAWYAGIDGPVDCIAAGFSCRDISAAGRGAGLGGESTGPTYRGCLAAIRSFRPAWVIFENSPRIRTMGRDVVTADLVALGYRWRDGVISAADVGAPHIRDRWFLLAHRADVVRFASKGRGAGGCETAERARRNNESPRVASDTTRRRRDQGAELTLRSRQSWAIGEPEPFADTDGHRQQQPQGAEPDERRRTADGVETAPDTLRDRLQIAVQRGGLSEPGAAAIEAAARYCGAYHWNPADPGLLRVVDGLADRGKRIKALGDAWVPIQAAAAWRLLGGPIA